MSLNNLVPVHHFCLYHQVEFSFIDSLHEYGLIKMIVIKDNKYLLQEDLREIEKMVHFYYELGINLEGIEVISNLLIQNASLQRELDIVRKKLILFENGEVEEQLI